MFKKGFILAAFLGFGISEAYATSTYRCEGEKTGRDFVYSYFIEFNVGTIGRPNRLTVGFNHSDDFVELDSERADQITMYYSDRNGMAMQIRDSHYNQVIAKLKTIRDPESSEEAGFLTYAGETVAVTCEQVG